jgi:S-adenosylmethionine decarboxylase
LEKFDTVGTEVLVDLYDCQNYSLLNNIEELRKISHEAIDLSGATIKKEVYHQFSPQGITLLIVLAESSMSLHTYPEHRYITINIYTCGKKANPLKAMDYMVNVLKPKNFDGKVITRGDKEMKINKY